MTKKDPQKIFEVLDINGLPSLCHVQKDSTNVEVLKIKINDLYRDMKSRNQEVKSSVLSYLSRYHGESNDLRQR